MTDDLTREMAEAVAKQLPVKDVYQDVGQPALREAGGLLGDLAKTARLLLTAPIQYTAALQDRYQRFLETSVRNVPEERLIAPAPQILGPVLEGIKYEVEDSSLSEMFSNLLSKAMDTQSVHMAHPAFAQILKQLSPDEARILHILRDIALNPPGKPSTEDEQKNFKPGMVVHQRIEREVMFPANIYTYIDHLNALGLVEYHLSPKSLDIDSMKEHRFFHHFGTYRLLPWGRSFIDACSS